ncbi:MAG: hypothetical protein GWP08_03575 [Nitrospiraceae bacterium]|nr:hypothetical protein [Nitrospiraceae bacterium]
MPRSYHYYEECRILVTRYWGNVTSEDMLEQARLVNEDHRIGPGTRELVDLRGVERVSASTESLKAVIENDSREPERYRGFRVGVVAPDDLTFGLTRMYATMTEVGDAPSVIKAFRTMEEAKQWLGIGDDELEPSAE